ncbi:MAG: DUF5713 family protein [Saprospiraceae bacterium]
MEPDASFEIVDVDQLDKILKNYLANIEQTDSKEEALSLVEQTVESINELNESSDEEMIETMERESIAEVINLACFLKGYCEKDEDLTEEYREW